MKALTAVAYLAIILAFVVVLFQWWTMPEVMFSSATNAPLYMVDYQGVKHPVTAETLPQQYEKVWVK